MLFFLQILLLGCSILIASSKTNVNQSSLQGGDSRGFYDKNSNSSIIENCNSSFNILKNDNFSQICINNVTGDSNSLEGKYTNDYAPPFTNTFSQESTLLGSNNLNKELIRRNANDIKFPSFFKCNFDENTEGSKNLFIDEERLESEMNEKSNQGVASKRFDENGNFESRFQNYHMPYTNSYNLNHQNDPRFIVRSRNLIMDDYNRFVNHLKYHSMPYDGTEDGSNFPHDDPEENSMKIQSNLNVAPHSIIPLQMKKRGDILLRDLGEKIGPKRNDIQKNSQISDNDSDDNINGFITDEKTIMDLKPSDHKTYGDVLHDTYDAVSFVPKTHVSDDFRKVNYNREMNIEDENTDIDIKSMPFEIKSDNNVSSSNINSSGMTYDFNMLSDLYQSLNRFHDFSSDGLKFHGRLYANDGNNNDRTFNEDNLPTKPIPCFVPKRTGRKRFKLNNPHPQTDERNRRITLQNVK